MGFIELMGGNTEVEDDSVDGEGGEFVGYVVESTKRGLNEVNAIAECLQSVSSFRDGIAVEVESDQPAVWRGALENRGRMTATAECSVDDD
jgi:hypothetical protein